MKLANKVAIATGAGSGMGSEEAKMFAAEGAKVVITDIVESACRPGGADEFAHVVTFVASDEASYLAGAEIMVDGAMIC